VSAGQSFTPKGCGHVPFLWRNPGSYRDDGPFSKLLQVLCWPQEVSIYERQKRKADLDQGHGAQSGQSQLKDFLIHFADSDSESDIWTDGRSLFFFDQVCKSSKA
jgi:hypothetical protein